ncbi:MAG: hypothetical protein INR70_43730 [Parafilimonas terrae]|nr:hypothetical protein [Parafilimonas terrae]
MPVAILILAVVWASAMAIVVVVAVHMDAGISCLASAASTLPEDGGDHVATRMDDV